MPVQETSNKGFTILELLVVVTILGLIASIVLVAAKNAGERARIKGLLQFSTSIYHSTTDNAIYWNFNNVSGVNVPDLSGNGKDGTISGNGTWETVNDFVSGNSIKQTGGNNVCISTDNIELKSGSATAEIWVKPSSASGSDFILQVGDPGTPCGLLGDYFFRFSTSLPTEYYLWVRQESGSYCSFWFRSSSLFANKWNHIVFSYDGAKSSNQGTFYLNAQKIPYLVANCPATGRIIGSGDRATVTLNSNLAIDEFRLYDMPLTVSGIQKHYAEGLQKRELAGKLFSR